MNSLTWFKEPWPQESPKVSLYLSTYLGVFLKCASRAQHDAWTRKCPTNGVLNELVTTSKAVFYFNEADLELDLVHEYLCMPLFIMCFINILLNTTIKPMAEWEVEWFDWSNKKFKFHIKTRLICDSGVWTNFSNMFKYCHKLK